MDTKIFVLILAAFCTIIQSEAGLISVPTVRVLQGPGSRTTIVGPDGAAISSVSPGGTVVTDGSASVPAGPAILGVGPQTVVGGPSGSIITTYTAAGPAVVPAAAVAVAPQAVLSAGPVAVPAIEEGQYIPDNTEQLYDDGSYKGEQ